MSKFTIENGKLLRYEGNEACAVIPDGVTNIGEYAFENSVHLTSVTLPKGLVTISEGAFLGSSITAIELPHGITTVCSSAFEECRALTRAVLPDSVTSMGTSVFSGCTSLADVRLPERLTAIPSHTFRNCSALCRIAIPKSVKRILQGAFWNCGALTELILPSGIGEIEYGAFENVPHFRVPVSGMDYFEKDIHEYLWEKAVLGFLRAYYSGKSSEEENAEWRKYISRRTVKLLRLLQNEPLLYSFLTEQRILSPKRVSPLLEETEDPECRAILLAYSEKQQNKVSDKKMDQKFKLD